MAGRIIKGVGWSAAQQFSTQIIQFVISIILARLLSPSEFGIVAASMIVLTILQVINETGFGAALMQKLDRDETDFFSVFVLNIIMGLVLYILLFISAPLWAIIFKVPELTKVIRLLGLNLIFGSFMVVQRTKLLIKVDFKTWTKASVSAALIAGVVAVVMAYHNYGVYSLVCQSLFSSFLSTLFIWYMVKWKPNMQFSFVRLKSLFNFAYKLIAARVVNTIFNEVYSSVVAIFFTPAQLAFFNRANSFVSLSSNNIVSIIQRVSIPVLCEHQNSESELRNLVLKFVKNSSLIITPLTVLLFVLAEPLVICLLTEKWLQSVFILKIICATGLFYNISAFNMNVYNATGRTDLALKCEIVKKIISIIIIAGTLYLQNFTFLIVSYTVCSFVEFIINVKFTYSQIHTTIWMYMKSNGGIMMNALFMGMVIYLLKTYFVNSYVQLFGLSALGLVVYIVGCYMFNICNMRSMVNKYWPKLH